MSHASNWPLARQRCYRRRARQWKLFSDALTHVVNTARATFSRDDGDGRADAFDSR